MRHLLGLLVLVASPGMLCAAVSAAPPSASAPAAVDARVASAVDRFAVKAIDGKVTAGLAVGVVQDGRFRLVRGYGFSDLENKVPVHERTVFRIGSVTKQFTAATILLLAERGALSVDDPVSKYFHNFPGGAGVTLRHLLNHTSGIHNYTADGFFRTAARQDRATSEMVSYIAGLNPLYDFKPGSAWSYSNSGYMLLGAVVEKVSGQPFDQFLNKNILEPLELRDTAMDDLAEILPNRARGYEVSKESPTGFANTSFISMSAAAAAGAMRSTPADLLKWQAALFGGKLLRPKSLAMMIEPARLSDGRLTSLGRRDKQGATPPAEYGLGLTIDLQKGRRFIGHGGSINGFNAWIQSFPEERLSVVLLTNTGGAAYAMAPELVETIFGALEQ